MTRLMRASDTLGLPVVSIESGEDIAEIRDVVYDAANHALIGFTLNKRGLFAGRMRSVLPAGAISAIGPAAVMVDGDQVVQEAPNELQTASSSDEMVPVLGNRVVAGDGSELGEVSGVVLSVGGEEGNATEAVGYELTGDDGVAFVPISAQMAISADNLILPDEATQFMHNDLAGFGAAVTSYRSEMLHLANEETPR